MALHDVAVVGAGIAGLACAVTLSEAGLAVTVFDKGHRPGGRVATRTREKVSFDHGAQFAAARGEDFGKILREMCDGGMAAPWPAASTGHATRFVGVPGMWAIPRCMAAWLDVPPLQQRHVAWLARDHGWRLRHHAAETIAPGTVTPDGGLQAGPFDAVVVALPAPQAAALLAPAQADFAAQAATATYLPCWAVMASFAKELDLPDTARFEAGPIAWLARESSRPGRPDLPERFVVHASADWSRERLEEPAERVTEALLGHLAGMTKLPRHTASAQRWRYAMVERALDKPCLWDPASGVGACGDWCLGGRVEAAWDSGRALAAAMLA